MSDAVSIALAAGLACVLAIAATPIAIRIAMRTGLYDVPSGWKEHAQATPFLGGLAVVGSSFAAAIALGAVSEETAAVAGAAALVLAVGICDDRWEIPALLRVGSEVIAGVLLWTGNVAWQFSVPEAINLLLTVFWVIGVINAINLLDLMDGVAGASVGAGAIAVAVTAGLIGEVDFAVVAAALGGACAGYLRFNLARPARIFLGDGGSMPLGLILGACAMHVSAAGISDGAALLTASLFVGIPLADMAFRIVLRLRHRISLMTPGPDSLANRLRERLGEPHRVAASFAIAQLVAGAAAAVAVSEGSGTDAIVAFTGFVVVGAIVAVWLDRSVVTGSATPAYPQRSRESGGAGRLLRGEGKPHPSPDPGGG